MQVTAVLAFGLVLLAMLRGCEPRRTNPWKMKIDDDTELEKIRCMEILGLQSMGEIKKEGDGAPSGSATDRQSRKPGYRKNHLTAMDDDKDEDAALWNGLGAQRKPPENVGACLRGEHQAYLLFRMYVNTFRSLIKEKVKEKYGESTGWTNDFVVRVSMDSEKLRVMEHFGADGNLNLDSLTNVHEVMTSMLLSVNYPQHESKSWVENFIGWTPRECAKIILGCVLIFMAPKLLYMAYITVLYFRITWFRLMLLLAAVAFVWKGYAMYMTEQVNSEVALSHNYGQDCVQPVGFWQRIEKGFFFSKDKCHEFHYHTMIDPIWKVSPAKILAELLSDFIWTFVGTGGAPIAKFVTDLFGEVPFYVWPVAGIFAVLLFLLLFTLISGSSLKLLYGFVHIGERPKAIVSPGSDDIKAEYEALKIEMAALRKENAQLWSGMEAIEMNAGGDAKPAKRVAGFPPKKAIRAAKHKLEKTHIGNGSAAGASHEYSSDPRHADNIGPRSSTNETRRRSTEVRGGQGDTQDSTNYNATRDRKYECQTDTESDSSQENDSGPENQAAAVGEDRCRATKTDSPRPVTIASFL